MSEVKQIYILIPKITAEVDAVGKDHENKEQKYKFRSIDDVYNVLNEQLGKYQVSIFPTYTVMKNDIVQTKTGSMQRNVVLQGVYKFTAPDGSFEEATTFGEAIDYSDKAFNKAMSQAFKYALFQVFCIPTEEEKDTEHDNPKIESQPQVLRPSSQQSAINSQQPSELEKRAAAIYFKCTGNKEGQYGLSKEKYSEMLKAYHEQGRISTTYGKKWTLSDIEFLESELTDLPF